MLIYLKICINKNPVQIRLFHLNIVQNIALLTKFSKIHHPYSRVVTRRGIIIENILYILEVSPQIRHYLFNIIRIL